jgi:hypothetical protein
LFVFALVIVVVIVFFRCVHQKKFDPSLFNDDIDDVEGDPGIASNLIRKEISIWFQKLSSSSLSSMLSGRQQRADERRRRARARADRQQQHDRQRTYAFDIHELFFFLECFVCARFAEQDPTNQGDDEPLNMKVWEETK